MSELTKKVISLSQQKLQGQRSRKDINTMQRNLLVHKILKEAQKHYEEEIIQIKYMNSFMVSYKRVSSDDNSLADSSKRLKNYDDDSDWLFDQLISILS